MLIKTIFRQKIIKRKLKKIKINNENRIKEFRGYMKEYLFGMIDKNMNINFIIGDLISRNFEFFQKPAYN